MQYLICPVMMFDFEQHICRSLIVFAQKAPSKERDTMLKPLHTSWSVPCRPARVNTIADDVFIDKENIDSARQAYHS